jgi:formate--tetrahydrofolate ligase
MPEPASDWEIARTARPKPIVEIARDRLGIPVECVEPYGHTKAKIGLDLVQTALAARGNGKLILVTAISPTTAGEGKTTVSIGLGDGLNRIGKKALICLREPSLGPCFGMKGGATGGGYSQVVPMDDINLHFTGDFHAIGAANNLLAAMIDNHIYWGNSLGIDPRRVTWRRCVDMNERALRQIVSSLGGITNGFPREDGFDITVASEIMAILCLTNSLADLERRLANIIVASTRQRKPIRVSDLKAQGAMAVLLKDALKPNLVQTLENNPAFVHGGPFANIAHGCNSIMATSLALKLADYVVTEAGFGADLGAEKFFNIKCRKAGLRPDIAVMVASVRALKMHGGVAHKDLGIPDPTAVKSGLPNLERHVRNVRRFSVPVVVCINRFTADTDNEIAAVLEGCRAFDAKGIVCTEWADGGKGAESLARAVVSDIDQRKADFHPLYPDDMPLLDKIKTVATEIYGAGEVVAPKPVIDRLNELEKQGFGSLPVCIAKTQYSFSANSHLLNAPIGFDFPIRDIRLAAGAEFVVAICGDIMTMPGLPRVPRAEHIRLEPGGCVAGL